VRGNRRPHSSSDASAWREVEVRGSAASSDSTASVQRATPDLKALAHEAGLHPAYISLLERGQRNPSLGTVQVLAGALRTTMTSQVREVESRQTGAAPPSGWSTKSPSPRRACGGQREVAHRASETDYCDTADTCR